MDPHKPVQVLVDTTLAFGASTRRFTLRERPNAHLGNLDSKQEKDDADAGRHSLLGLPEEDTELEVRAGWAIVLSMGPHGEQKIFWGEDKMFTSVLLNINCVFCIKRSSE